MADTLDALTADLQSYVVAPLAAFGMGGYVFDVQGEAIANLSADITDHYSEDNRALQDHIAIRPKKITLKGYVGELVYSTDGSSGTFLQQAVQKLTEISAFLPTLSASATQLQQAIEQPSDASLTLSDASNIYGVVKNLLGASGNEARQQNAYNYFKALMTQGVLMGIQTPWEFMTNMAIESITAIQGEPSIFITDFAVTFKEIRIAKVLTTAYSVAQALQGDAAIQALPPIALGNVPGVALPTSLLPGAQSQIATASSFHALAGIGNLFSFQGG